MVSQSVARSASRSGSRAVGRSVAVLQRENGAAGAAGLLVLLLVDVCIYLYGRYINKEKVFGTAFSD
ncbi:MAG: hypothetical protein IKP46_04625 [Bacteroidales bacterium]|nr:hypothetical protein [Bacteroidales bacterium]